VIQTGEKLLNLASNHSNQRVWLNGCWTRI
jgi:hypothetical protein